MQVRGDTSRIYALGGSFISILQSLLVENKKLTVLINNINQPQQYELNHSSVIP
jgi:hypothetical protein